MEITNSLSIYICIFFLTHSTHILPLEGTPYFQFWLEYQSNFLQIKIKLAIPLLVLGVGNWF